MITLSYDGTFEGFICAVACLLEQGERCAEFVHEGDATADGLFAGAIQQVATVRETVLALRRRFVAAASQEAFATARYAFHSQQRGIEQLLWRYLMLGLEKGGALTGMLTIEPVYSIHRIARRVSHEAHKYKGFVRFREVAEGFLYASIEPEADVLLLIAPHFVQRVNDRPWMILDICRSQAALYDLTSWRLVSGIELIAEPGVTPAEHENAALWQRYFQCHAIIERHNPTLQQKHVPLRVRKHLTEFTAP